MYYWIVPPDETVKDERGRDKPYSWSDLQIEVVATHEVWRSGDEGVLKAYDEVEEKCFDAVEGDLIGMTDTTYEIYLPALTLQGHKINKASARQFNRMIRPVITASRKRPEGYEEKAKAGGDGQKQATVEEKAPIVAG